MKHVNGTRWFRNSKSRPQPLSLQVLELIWISHLLWTWRSSCSWNGRMGWLLSLEWLSYFQHIVQSLSISCVFFSIHSWRATPNHTPLYHSKFGVRLRWVIELGTSSLVYVCTSGCLLNIVGRMYHGTAHSKVWGSLHAHNHNACERGSGGEGPGQQLDTKCQDGVQPLRDTKVWAAEIRGEPGRCVYCCGDSEATSARAGVGPFGHHSGRCVHQSRTTSRWRSEAFLNDTIIRAHCVECAHNNWPPWNECMKDGGVSQSIPKVWKLLYLLLCKWGECSVRVLIRGRGRVWWSNIGMCECWVFPNITLEDVFIRVARQASADLELSQTT